MIKISILLALLIAFTYALCYSQKLSVEIEKNDELEHLVNSARFGLPVLITSDEDHIYIADEQALNIKVFNRKIKEHYTIGRRGRGPGEFMHFDLITHSSNALYVYDTFGNSKYVVYSNNGEIINELPVKTDGTNRIFRPRQIIHLDDDFIVILSNNYSVNTNILHIWSADLHTHTASFLDMSKLKGNSSFVNALNNSIAGSSVEKYNGNLIYVNRVPFDGLHLTNLISGEYTFKPVKYDSEAFRETNENLHKDRVFIRNNSPAGSLSGYIYRLNAGLFQTGEDFLIHFLAEHSLADSGETNNWDLHVTVFDKELNVVTNQKLIENIPLMSFRQPAVRHRDEKGNFYLLHYDVDNYPRISVFTLKINQ